MKSAMSVLIAMEAGVGRSAMVRNRTFTVLINKVANAVFKLVKHQIL
jgi:hypothetical protein